MFRKFVPLSVQSFLNFSNECTLSTYLCIWDPTKIWSCRNLHTDNLRYIMFIIFIYAIRVNIQFSISGDFISLSSIKANLKYLDWVHYSRCDCTFMKNIEVWKSLSSIKFSHRTALPTPYGKKCKQRITFIFTYQIILYPIWVASTYFPVAVESKGRYNTSNHHLLWWVCRVSGKD